MPEPLSERSFQKGLRAVRHGEFLEALVYFEASMQLAQRAGAQPSSPIKYLSYYGLCLAMTSYRVEEGREICENAVRAEFYNPDLYLNLGKVYLKAGDRGLAFETLVRGLQLNPRHPDLVKEVRRLGVRRRPIVGFLSRSHPLNRMLGRLQADAARVGNAAGRSARRSHGAD